MTVARTLQRAAAIALASVLLAAAPGLRLTIGPWHGKNLPTAGDASVRYRLIVQGAPNQSVDLQAREVTAGWIAAFCTDRVCSPQRVSTTLPAGGSTILQFELIREDSDAAAGGSARITAGSASVRVP